MRGKENGENETKNIKDFEKLLLRDKNIKEKMKRIKIIITIFILDNVSNIISNI
jgi:hypothetical protein